MLNFAPPQVQARSLCRALSQVFMGSIYDNNARALFFLQITMSLKRALSSHQPFPNQSGIGGLQPVRMPVLNKLYPPPNRRARGRAQAKNLEPRAAADCRDLL